MKDSVEQFLDSLNLEELGIQKYLDQLPLEKVSCKYSDHACDYCENPEGDIWCAISGYEYREVEYDICEKCAKKQIESGNKGLDQNMMQMKHDPNLPF